MSGVNVTLFANVITVQGRVTRNGLPLESVEPGSSRGALVFESLRPPASARLELGARSDGAFSLTLPPAIYRVRWEANNELTPAPGWHMANRALVMDELDLRAARDVQIDVSPRTMSFDLRVDGRDPNASMFAELVPANDPNIRAFASVSLAANRATLELPGRGHTYDVSVGYSILPTACSQPDSLLPCELRALGAMREGDPSPAISLETVASSLQLEVDGAPAPASWGAARVQLRSRHASPVEYDLARASAGRRLWAGRYDVSLLRPTTRIEDLPLNDAQVGADVSFERSGVVTVRARTAMITQRLKVEGRPIELWRAPGVTPSLLLLDRDGTILMRAPITDHAQRFRIFHSHATIALAIDGACDRAQPCGAAVLRPFGPIDRDIELVRDVPLACISLVAAVDDRPPSVLFRQSVQARPSIARELAFSLSAPLGRDGVVHILAGDYALTGSTGCETSHCVSIALHASRRWEGLRNDRVDFFTQTTRAELVVRDVTSRATIPYDRAVLSWVDPSGASTRSIARGDGSFDAFFPRGPVVGVVSGEFPCSLDPPTRSVCFTTPVFGCDR
ncbi:MAG: hypothetical protein JNK05_40195 [Myxococcales bacterium]|nr:hypothetical protein [Myxococcales bacterium]